MPIKMTEIGDIWSLNDGSYRKVIDLYRNDNYGRMEIGTIESTKEEYEKQIREGENDKNKNIEL